MNTATTYRPALREGLRITGVLVGAGMLTLTVLTGSAALVQLWG